MSGHHIVVAGFGRCGSSLTMQMLAAAGVPCIGRHPAYEVDEANHRAIDPTFLARHPGAAIKVLNPQRCPWPPGVNRRVIFLRRDARQQARSQAKFLQLMAGVSVERSARRAIAASLARDEAAYLASLDVAVPRMLLRFETIIERPRSAAEAIAHFLDLAPDTIDRMAREVLPRATRCEPALAIEELLTVRGAA